MDIYRVVVNHEEQYSIWPEYKELPLGWSAEGFSGNKQECLDHIDVIWKDITPKSVREQIERARSERGEINSQA